jgi:hypothetical protein
MSFERLNAIRTEIAEIKQSIINIGNESLNEKDAIAVIDESLAKLRANFDVTHLGMLCAKGQKIEAADFLNAGFGDEKVPSMLATFMADKMREMLIESAKPFTDKKATPVAQRGENVLELQQKLLELEKLDEALFTDLEDQGYGPANGLTRRADADMATILLVAEEDQDI